MANKKDFVTPNLGDQNACCCCGLIYYLLVTNPHHQCADGIRYSTRA